MCLTASFLATGFVKLLHKFHDFSMRIQFFSNSKFFHAWNFFVIFQDFQSLWEPWFSQILFVAVFLGYNQYWPGGFMVLLFSVQEHLKAQPVVILISKCLRRQGHRLKSHPTDWEKPGIEPATPGLQYIGLSPTPPRLSSSNLCLAWQRLTCLWNINHDIKLQLNKDMVKTLYIV